MCDRRKSGIKLVFLFEKLKYKYLYQTKNSYQIVLNGRTKFYNNYQCIMVNQELSNKDFVVKFQSKRLLKNPTCLKLYASVNPFTCFQVTSQVYSSSFVKTNDA